MFCKFLKKNCKVFWRYQNY